MATSTQEILRLRRTDLGSEHFFLVNVSRHGPKAFDLELVGTDRDSIFSGNVKDDAVKSLQAANFSGDLDEWKSVLSYVLLHQTPDGPLPESLQAVEAVAAMSKTTVTITLRRNIGGILQKLGTIRLAKDEDREVDLLDWIDAAAKSSDELRSQLDALQESVTAQKDQIARLTADLDNLVRAKQEHENDLLSKFAALLNAKKLKIRDQQRLLTGAQIDPDAAAPAHRERSTSTTPAARSVGALRKGKRKVEDAPEHAAEDNQDDDEADGAGTADDDEEELERRQQLTSDTETEDEHDEDKHDDIMDSGAANGNDIGAKPDVSQEPRRIATRQSQPPSTQVNIVDAANPSRGQGQKNGKLRERSPPPPSTANDDEATDDDEL